jgi:threonine aldolase
LITIARGHRKMLGGGMRQAGVLAACGLVSISEPMISRLADDHKNARTLAEGLAKLPGVTIDLETVQTNIVFFGYTGKKGDAAALAKELNAAGVGCFAMGPKIRFVTHREISAEDTERALKIVQGIVA